MCWDQLTIDGKVDPNDHRGMSRYLTLICSLIFRANVADGKSPVVGVNKADGVAGVAGVLPLSHRQQAQRVVATLPEHPVHLQQQRNSTNSLTGNMHKVLTKNKH